MSQTKGYEFFQQRIQEIFDFAVLVTSSVPVLKQNLNLLEQNRIDRIPDPDYFEPSVVYELKQKTIDELQKNGLTEIQTHQLNALKDIPLNSGDFKTKLTLVLGVTMFNEKRNLLRTQSIKHIHNLRSCTSNYKEKLATYLYFSNFSYFEAFLIDVLKEATSQFPLSNINLHFNQTTSPQALKERLRLNKVTDFRKIDNYKKLSNSLRQTGYLAPNEILFNTMQIYMGEKLETLWANEIFTFLEKILMFKISKSDAETFGNIRDNRNTIAHGKNTFKPTLAHVISSNKFFKRIAKDLNNHVILHFSPLKNFVVK